MDVVVTSVAVFPSIHLSIGTALASAAMNMAMLFGFSIFTWFTWWGESEADSEAPEDQLLPVRSKLPTFLEDHGFKQTINLGVVGPSGSGKSSLINALRGLAAGDPDAAPVGVEATTVEPASYILRLDSCPGADIASPMSLTADSIGPSPTSIGTASPMSPDPPRDIRIWDLPAIGVNGPKHQDYVGDLGLPFFDVILTVYSQRITGLEVELAHCLEDTYKVPLLAVRSQVDLDVENEAMDNGRTEEEVVAQLREDALAEGFTSVYLVSARHPERYEFEQLVASIITMAKARHRAHSETECPICYESFGIDEDHACCTCHWCGNGVCSRCARELRGNQGEAPCPFCRRWTALAKPPLSYATEGRLAGH